MSDTWIQFEYSTQPLIFVELSTVNEMVFISVIGRRLEKYLRSECWCKQFFLTITTLVNIRWCILDMPAPLFVLPHQCSTTYTWCTAVVLSFCFFDVLRAEPQKTHTYKAWCYYQLSGHMSCTFSDFPLFDINSCDVISVHLHYCWEIAEISAAGWFLVLTIMIVQQPMQFHALNLFLTLLSTSSWWMFFIMWKKKQDKKAMIQH